MPYNFTSIFNRLVKPIPFIETDLTIKRLKTIANSCFNYLKQHPVNPTVTVLWPTPFNPEKTWVAHDSLIILALRLRGVKIIPIMCNKLQSDQCMIWAGVWQGTDEPGFEKRRKKLCQNCVDNDHQMWNILQLTPVKLNHYINEEERNMLWSQVDQIIDEDWESFCFQGYQAGFEARKAVVNNQLQGEIKPEFKNKAKELARFHLFNILALFKTYARVLEEYQPDRIMGNGAFYYHWGVLNHLAQGQGIPYYRYYPVGLHAYTWNYALNTTDIIQLSAAWPSWSQKSFSQEMADKVKSHLKQRQFYIDKHDDPNLESRCEQITQKLRLDPQKPVLLLLTGVIWDANTNVSSPAFKTMYDWLWYSIEWAKAHPEIEVIIRVHPADISVPTVAPNTRSSFAKELSSKNIDVPSNIRIIHAEDKTDTYDLMHIAKVAACYMSTTGLEFSILGKPLIAIGNIHYTNKGFTLEPKTQEEYASLLIETLHGKTEYNPSTALLAQKYWYLYAFHCSTDLGLMEKVKADHLGLKRGIDVFTTNPKLLTYHDLLPGANRQLDYLCDAIIHDRPLLGENQWPPEYTPEVMATQMPA